MVVSYRKHEEKPRQTGQCGPRLLGSKCQHLLQSEKQQNVSNSTTLYQGEPSRVPSSLGFTAPGARVKNSTGATKRSSTPGPRRPASQHEHDNPSLTVSSAISPIPTEGERIKMSKSRNQILTKLEAQALEQNNEKLAAESKQFPENPKVSSTDCKSTKEEGNISAMCVA